jgi:chromosome segregation protein
VLGAVAALVTVQDGAQDAVAAALGGAADAVAVDSLEAAVAILEALKSEDRGSAGLVIAGTPAGPDSADSADSADRADPAAAAARADLPEGTALAIDCVKAPGELARAVAGLLAGVVIAEDLGQARDVLRTHPALRVVTRDGDLLGAHWAIGGSARPPSMLALRGAADDAAARLVQAEKHCEQVAARLSEAAAVEEEARQAVARALAKTKEADAAAAEISGRLGRLAGAARAARDEADRRAAAIAAAEQARDSGLAALTELENRLAAAEAETGEPRDGEPRDGEPREPRGGEQAAPSGAAPGDPELGKGALAQAATGARNAEMEARLEVRTAEERLAAIAGRADALAAAAAAERQAAAQALARRALRARQAVVARAVAEGAALALVRLTESLAAAAEQRQAAEQASKGRAEGLKEVRGQVRQLAAELDAVVDSAHGTEIARAEQRMRLEQLAARATEEFGVDVAALVAEYGPDVLIPAPVEAPADTTESGPAASAESGSAEGAAEPPTRYIRAEQERRAAAAQRQLDQLGKVNPLALEEFAALEERHSFLAAQLEDLKKTRRDLLTVVKEVDDRVQQVFTAAFEDTAREFEDIFGRLFPGGEGRLVLTEPDDMLATGIDFEARPPGKKVKRLSLLSGGERSLTAIAFLVAIFKARPSPFYVLDEVEAALDDTNLQRLLHIFEELRASSQLIIVTHQKRTMEIADALYGISMRGDGVSSVVSQRLRERESA